MRFKKCCLYAIFCKGVGRAFLNISNESIPFNLNIVFYIGGIVGCIIYYLIYHFLKKCNNASWNITFSAFALSMFVYAVDETIFLKTLFAFLVGIASTMGIINMYYILGVIGKKYWNQKYVKLSVFFIGVCGGASGVLLGRYLTTSNNINMSIGVAIISIFIVIVLLSISPNLALSYYKEEWEEDATKTEHDNLNIRKFKKYPLTDREIEIVKGILSGNTDRQIAAYLGLKEYTVSSYCKKIYSKLNVHSRAEIKKIFH